MQDENEFVSLPVIVSRPLTPLVLSALDDKTTEVERGECRFVYVNGGHQAL